MITAQGIKFNDKCYSCSLAIQEQWFEHVRTTGPIDVKVYFDSMDYTDVALIINTAFVCRKVIGLNNTQFDPEEYYRKLHWFGNTERRSSERKGEEQCSQQYIHESLQYAGSRGGQFRAPNITLHEKAKELGIKNEAIKVYREGCSSEDIERPTMNELRQAINDHLIDRVIFR